MGVKLGLSHYRNNTD